MTDSQTTLVEPLGREDAYCAAAWLKAGRDPAVVAGWLHTSVAAVERCRDHARDGYTPTPGEIERLTRMIRSKWPKEEHARRRTPRQPAIRQYGTARDWSLELLG